jgi:ABC-2 type transport system permease protein
VSAVLGRILALMKKEFLAVLKDARSRVLLVVPPMIQLLVFGYAATYDLKHVPYAIYNEDRGALSRELEADLRGSTYFREAVRISSNDQIGPLVDGREVLLVIHIGPRFGRDLASGRPAPLQLIVDGRNSNTALVAVGYVRQIVARFSDAWSEAHGLPRAPVRLETRAWFNPNLESRWFFLPGIIGILTLLITMLLTGLTVAREREQGTFDQLLVTPLRPFEVLAGKALPGFIGTLDLGLALFLLSAVGMGLMISALAATQQQGLLGAFLFMVPAVILSGFATPIANMPAAVRLLTYIDPLRYFLVVLRKLFLEGVPASILVHELWPMALIGAVSLSLAAWLFRARMV